MDVSTLYSNEILYYAGNIPRCGRLFKPQYSAEKFNRLCGSRVIVDYSMDNDKFSDFAQEIEACALGQTSASIIAHHIIGESWDRFMILSEQIRMMLEQGAKPPSGRWRDFALLKCVSDFPARHASVMLVFEAIKLAHKKNNVTTV